MNSWPAEYTQCLNYITKQTISTCEALTLLCRVTEALEIQKQWEYLQWFNIPSKIRYFGFRLDVMA